VKHLLRDLAADHFVTIDCAEDDVPVERTTYERRMIDLRQYVSGYGTDALVCQTDDGKWWRKFAGEMAWTEEVGPR